MKYRKRVIAVASLAIAGFASAGALHFTQAAQSTAQLLDGQVISWKNFLPNSGGPYTTSDATDLPSNQRSFTVPDFPANPIYHKVLQQSAITCRVMFDVRFADQRTVKMTLAADPVDPNVELHPRWIQGLTGYPNEITTFAFSITMLQGAPAGDYTYYVIMNPVSGAPTTFNDQVGKIQCEERSLPQGES